MLVWGRVLASRRQVGHFPALNLGRCLAPHPTDSAVTSDHFLPSDFCSEMRQNGKGEDGRKEWERSAQALAKEERPLALDPRIQGKALPPFQRLGSRSGLSVVEGGVGDLVVHGPHTSGHQSETRSPVDTRKPWQGFLKGREYIHFRSHVWQYTSCNYSAPHILYSAQPGGVS